MVENDNHLNGGVWSREHPDMHRVIQPYTLYKCQHCYKEFSEIENANVHCRPVVKEFKLYPPEKKDGSGC